jgi:hypothetical protein
MLSKVITLPLEFIGASFAILARVCFSTADAVRGKKQEKYVSGGKYKGDPRYNT